jgi:hypothetical protein
LVGIGQPSDAYLALEGEAAKVGLKINEQKTKYMIAVWPGMIGRFLTWGKRWPNSSRKTEIQVGGWTDSLAIGVRDWTYCAQDRQTWRDLLQQTFFFVCFFIFFY